MKLSYLGGLTAAEFISEYWQKRPLLIRQAFPGFGDALSPNELAGLACEEDAQSRLVLEKRGKWSLEHGPFDEERFADLPKKGWSLLVQGVNHFLPEGEALLKKFDFIPTARLDDLMVSYAPEGGGVGPHFDAYDVFLLQGIGTRIWRISQQEDRTLIEGAPLRILKNFKTEQEWTLEPGDMLYLPPGCGHWGVAVDPCMTWSIGFRTPSAQELGTQFLSYVQEKLCLDGMYADPDLIPQSHPAEISDQMVDKVEQLLKGLTWNRQDIAGFLGQYLTEPKPHIVFSPKRISLVAWTEKLPEKGIRLDLKSLMLIQANRVFLNGETFEVSDADLPIMHVLASRETVFEANEHVSVDKLWPWFKAGYLVWGQ